MSKVPKPFQRFLQAFPEVEKAHMELSLAVNRQGPLGERDRRLVRLGIAIGQQSRGGVKSHARRALEEGVSPDELRHAALLALPTLGFPAMIAALEWIEEVLEEGA
ncbi:MAG: carboxymuconolactone decarboxylase family protein [Candidatus Dadabacteria bacterium]|nr:MAG: carboxymuconolactone decarboxylase family protein [Candidatus Dadabacteria bacterium]